MNLIRKERKLVFKIISFLIATCLFNITCAEETPSKPVNILTWWGYLDKPWIKPYIQQKCGADISFDEYYANDEFNKFWALHKTNYDIVIFEDTFYNIIADELKNKGTDVSDLANNYYPPIKKEYFYKKYPKNILYFFQSVTVFLWNPKIMDLNRNNSINNIFQLTGNNAVVLLDDPIVMSQFFNEAYHINWRYDSNELFNLIKNHNIYIANDYNKIYENKKFAFAYTWSGSGVSFSEKSGNKYQLTINPKYSYVSSDLIAQVSRSPQSSCVMKVLSSKDFLSQLQNETYYFSPYGDINKAKSSSFKNIYLYYLNHLSQLKWVDSIPTNQSEHANESWKLIKLRFMQ